MAADIRRVVASTAGAFDIRLTEYVVYPIDTRNVELSKVENLLPAVYRRSEIGEPQPVNIDTTTNSNALCGFIMDNLPTVRIHVASGAPLWMPAVATIMFCVIVHST